MDDTEILEWANTYIRAQINDVKIEHPDWVAINKFMEICTNSTPSFLEDCWNTILAILKLDKHKKVIGILAAGPLEDLIHYHGDKYIDKIEVEARRNSAFKELLGGVWESSSPDIWARVSKARGQTW